jgi:hypothetical protein
VASTVGNGAPKTGLMCRIMALSDIAIKPGTQLFNIFYCRAFLCLADAVQREGKHSHLWTTM